ncbi:NAD kinase [Agrobacterium cavarae]|uniref:NAD kinase n=1 Tax=Agrobacterium cavarae TaxID=2528239 RepID=UPI0030019F30
MVTACASKELVHQVSLHVPEIINRDGRMSRSVHKISFVASSADHAQAAREELIREYGNASFDEADVIVALGGDGFMLQVLNETMNLGKRVYGMNRGSVGFLMNDYRLGRLHERIAVATGNDFHPLRMTTVDEDGNEVSALAMNEVSLFRQSHQAAKLRVDIDGKTRLEELICDGVMVATPAGSTAYNFSAHGPILPLESPLLALTPVSPFRPRRWRGALLPNKVTVDIHVQEGEKRPVNAVADHREVKSVRSVKIALSQDRTARILSDPDRSWSDRILAEQFTN